MNGNLYLSCLFFGLVHMMFNGFSELSLLIFRLPVFYKQRDNLFHPAWVWSVASFILRLPYSIVEAVVWSCVVYYTVGFAPGVGRWIKKSSIGNNTVGNNILSQHSLPSSDYWYWIGVGVLLLYVLVFNIIVTWALTYLNPLTRSRTVAPADVTPENSDGNDVTKEQRLLLLMKRGGRVIYGGKLGVHSKIMIDYFQGIKGVPPCPDGYNPATWMLEVTTSTVEERVGEDFAELFRKSYHYREVEASIMHFGSPLAGSEPLKFESTYARDALSQFLICLWKQNLVYWRSPQYNGVRLCFTVIAALILGSVFWNIGSKRDSTQALSVGLVEIPYILVQTIFYGIITYFMVDFERTADAIHSIPGWWLWFYYICPIAWTLRGIICSQLGDVETIIVGPGFEGTVKKYLEVTFGYGPDMIGASIAALVGFCLLFFIVFAFSVKFLNFQKR
ncbi:hypothetical protein OIU77_016996 [Salix suchowensis]|uniref:Uncharacterized protein n=1 Tax=Salix suchowensis TaxID=1278906 RepID=A0ABQ8ZMK7_9ROSI|nr:hypothetical protein OIU77_016996 [Salix suchowensis]